MAPICGEITLPKEYIKTKKLTNAPKLITQSEALAPEVIVVGKLRTDLSVNSVLTGETRASVDLFQPKTSTISTRALI